jgi:outer membrane protein assembly factor BamA
MVFRVFAGVAHAYGNSDQVSYSEQFYIGGANSLRAFGVRAVGPGSYHASADDVNGYYDQTGTFKFEFNAEYRFPLMGYLHGAVFVDAGNVWLLKKDASRPGGALGESAFFNQLALGTGAEVRVDLDMLVLRADLGIGIHAPYDTGKTGYYNMKSFKDSLAFHIAIGYPF